MPCAIREDMTIASLRNRIEILTWSLRHLPPVARETTAYELTRLRVQLRVRENELFGR
jgi:hypothetical protein